MVELKNIETFTFWVGDDDVLEINDVKKVELLFRELGSDFVENTTCYENEILFDILPVLLADTIRAYNLTELEFLSYFITLDSASSYKKVFKAFFKKHSEIGEIKKIEKIKDTTYLDWFINNKIPVT